MPLAAPPGPLPERRTDWRPRGGDLSGAVADLGVLVPLLAGLVLVNGLRPGPVLVAAGSLVVASGLNFRIPWPVQPLKALAAIAIAGELPPEMIHAGGLLIGASLVLLTLTGSTRRLAALFTLPVIRSLQLGVGVLLVLAAVELAVRPPAVFAASSPGRWTLLLAGWTVALVAIAAWRRWHVVAVAILVVGTLVTWAGAAPELGPVTPAVPRFVAPDPSLLLPAFLLLVVPQLPLTFGNAVVGVSDLAREHFGERAARATPSRVAVSAGVANIASALIGGMPMCHGSSGLTAHVRLGATSAAMNLVLGSVLLLGGLLFPQQVLALFGVLPAWALAGFLIHAGVRHAGLVADQRGAALVVAIVAGGAGALTGNLALTTALALAGQHAPTVGRWTRRRAMALTDA